jgi:hypothetical protein
MPMFPPSPPLPPARIAEFTPMTRPVASMSGPPELPGLIAASVWITSSIAKPLGASMRRCRADTTPVVSVRSRPNGLPIATVGSPTSTSRLLPRASGRSPSPSGSTLSTARSLETSWPRTRAVTVRSSENRTLTRSAFWMTWAFVRMLPSRSSTKPVPVDSPRWSGATSKIVGCCWTTCARMNTTPGPSRL